MEGDRGCCRVGRIGGHGGQVGTAPERGEPCLQGSRLRCRVCRDEGDPDSLRCTAVLKPPSACRLNDHAHGQRAGSGDHDGQRPAVRLRPGLPGVQQRAGAEPVHVEELKPPPGRTWRGERGLFQQLAKITVADPHQYSLGRPPPLRQVSDEAGNVGVRSLVATDDEGQPCGFEPGTSENHRIGRIATHQQNALLGAGGYRRLGGIPVDGDDPVPTLAEVARQAHSARSEPHDENVMAEHYPHPEPDPLLREYRGKDAEASVGDGERREPACDLQRGRHRRGQILVEGEQRDSPVEFVEKRLRLPVLPEPDDAEDERGSHRDSSYRPAVLTPQDTHPPIPVRPPCHRSRPPCHRWLPSSLTAGNPRQAHRPAGRRRQATPADFS